MNVKTSFLQGQDSRSLRGNIAFVPQKKLLQRFAFAICPQKVLPARQVKMPNEGGHSQPHASSLGTSIHHFLRTGYSTFSEGLCRTLGSITRQTRAQNPVPRHAETFRARYRKFVYRNTDVVECAKLVCPVVSSRVHVRRVAHTHAT